MKRYAKFEFSQSHLIILEEYTVLQSFAGISGVINIYVA